MQTSFKLIFRSFTLIAIGLLILSLGCQPGGSGDKNVSPTIEPTEGPGFDPTTESTSPTATPEPANVGDFLLDRDQMEFSHIVGVTSCPQDIGQLIVTSTFLGPVNFLVSADGPLNIDPSSFTLESATTQIVNVNFTCAQSTSFVGALHVTGSGETKSIPVTGLISSN